MRPSRCGNKLLTGLILACSLFAACAEACAGPTYRVFVAHSYDAGYDWTGKINQGLEEALSGLDLEVRYFYLNAKHETDAGILHKRGAEAAAAINAFDPDVVVAADDTIQEYLVLPHLMGKHRPQVICCGVNARAERYGYPAANVSGVLEHYYFREGVALLKRIVPSAETIAFLSDSSETSRYIFDDLRHDMQADGYPLRVLAQETASTFQQWQERVLALQEKADALALVVYHSLKDEKTGHAMPVEDVVRWLNSVVCKPTLGFADFSVDHGLLCGVLESGAEQGYLAGTMVREVLLTNAAAGALPMRGNDKGMVFVNLNTAEALGLDIPYDIIEATALVVH